ncbi:MAG: hypothetical protein JEZ04_21935 [Spirochaetales bacterium]|nr:hypothetical protein [Spirochaetales bacterium]
MNRKRIIIFTLACLTVLLLLEIFFPSDILQEPLTKPLDFLSGKPFIDINLFGTDIILIVPSSTFFVYLLGIQTVILGISFLKTKNSTKHSWWSLSFIFWGIGALLAGTSYQGLGWELKCRGMEYCLFSSWFELSYLFFTALSMAAMTTAISKSVLSKAKERPLIIYGGIVLSVYMILLLTGTIASVRFLISYELFTLFFMPMFIVFFIISIIGYRKHKDKLNKTLIITWILFLVVNLSYYVYLFSGLTETLYQNFNIWFSANDVLHVTLIFWMLFIQLKLKKEISAKI